MVHLHFSVLITELQAEFDIFGKRFTFLLCKARHYRYQNFSTGIHRVYIFFLEKHRDIFLFQESDKFQTVYGISCKTADGFCNDHIDTAIHALTYHAVKILTLFCTCTTYAVIYVNAVFDTRENLNKQGPSAVLLRRKPSFFMPVFSFSATLPVKI